jgi:hypothetical protein
MDDGTADDRASRAGHAGERFLRARPRRSDLRGGARCGSQWISVEIHCLGIRL